MPRTLDSFLLSWLCSRTRVVCSELPWMTLHNFASCFPFWILISVPFTDFSLHACRLNGWFLSISRKFLCTYTFITATHCPAASDSSFCRSFLCAHSYVWLVLRLQRALPFSHVWAHILFETSLGLMSILGCPWHTRSLNSYLCQMWLDVQFPFWLDLSLRRKPLSTIFLCLHHPGLIPLSPRLKSPVEFCERLLS